jgi:hypothetical protein
VGNFSFVLVRLGARQVLRGRTCQHSSTMSRAYCPSLPCQAEN